MMSLGRRDRPCHATICQRCSGGMLFHVLIGGVGRRRLFEKEADDAAFTQRLTISLATIGVGNLLDHRAQTG